MMSSEKHCGWMILGTILVLVGGMGGCAKKNAIKTPTASIRQHEQFLTNVNRLAAQNRFSEATSACKDFLIHYPQSPVLDHALFQCGLVYASEQNPQKDYNQAVTLLRRISVEIPMSSYSPNATIVAFLVSSLGQLQASYGKQSETISSLQASEVRLVDMLSQLQASHGKQNETISALESTDAHQKQTIRELQALQAQQAQAIKELQGELEKIKRIDLRKRP